MTDPMAKMRSIATENWRQRIVKIDPHNATVTKQRMFYALVRQIKWLPDGILYAVMAELGPGVRTPKNELNDRWASHVRWRIGQRKQEMKNNGKSPRGAVASIFKEIAEEEGKPVETIRRQLKRIEDKRKK